MSKKNIFTLIGVVALIVVAGFVWKRPNIIPQVSVIDQSIIQDQIVVPSVTAVAPSWLVIQTETNSVPGPVIGYVKIKPGENKNIAVKIDTTKSTPKLFAMIHEDNGEKDKFDFPGNDMPLMYQGEMVSKIFAVK